MYLYPSKKSKTKSQTRRKTSTFCAVSNFLEEKNPRQYVLCFPISFDASLFFFLSLNHNFVSSCECFSEKTIPVHCYAGVNYTDVCLIFLYIQLH